MATSKRKPPTGHTGLQSAGHVAELLRKSWPRPHSGQRWESDMENAAMVEPPELKGRRENVMRV